MIGEEKLSSELFYVQDLRRECSACGRGEDISAYEGFSFYWGVFPSAGVRIISMDDVNRLENNRYCTNGLNRQCSCIRSICEDLAGGSVVSLKGCR